MLASVDLKEGVSISVPATSSTLAMLLQLLSTGFVVGRTRDEVAEVQEAAKALGLVLGECQVLVLFQVAVTDIFRVLLFLLVPP